MVVPATTGKIVNVINAAPAAGQEFTIAVPAARTWLLLMLFVELQASAVVADRRPFLCFFDPGGTRYWDSMAGLQTMATQLVRYMYPTFAFQQNNLAPHPLGYSFHVNPMLGMWMTGGSEIRSETLNLQAGDQYGSQRLVVAQY